MCGILRPVLITHVIFNLWLIHYQGGQIAVAHNGNLTNALGIRRQRLEADGSIFQTTMDSEVIVNLIARSKAETQRNGLPMRRVKLKGRSL